MQIRNSTSKLAHFRLRLSDLVLLVYIAAVTREFLWGIRGETLAWVLTTVVSVVILATHSFLREDFVGPDSQGFFSSKLTLIAYSAPLVVKRQPMP